MKFDGGLDIATGLSAKSKVWKNKKLQWSELVQRLSQEHKTTETYKEYVSSSKEEQGKIKDVGGYVGGYLRQGRRKPENVVHRQVMTLDIDFAHTDFWNDFEMQFENAAVLHSSHKHHEESPRYRLVMPLDREVTPDEYVAISRKVAAALNIDLFDNTTFETNRLMFWPSNPVDIDYVFRFQDGPWVNADEVLDSYIDWKDSSLWPTSSTQLQKVRSSAEKQEDPENKRGIVGAFCRTYSIEDVIESYLSDTYSQVGDGRYTYAKGTTSSGLIVYEGKFAFSHHGTDPCGGKLSNAFDLVRLHKFGDLDPEGYEGPPSKRRSFKAMEDLAREDKEVKKIIASENLADAKYDFNIDEDLQDTDPESMDWMQDMEIDGKGKYVSTAANINLIMANDSRFKGAFKHNEFNTRDYVFRNMPWRKVPKPEPINNTDYSGIRNYIECIYGVSGSLKIEDSLNLEFARNSFHPIKEYLKGLTWDKTPRVDTLLVDYLGAEDSIYTREAVRKMLVGAISRIMKPGCKFDLVLTLVGKQGHGKSTFINKLGGDWFSDTFLTVQGKEGLEQIQGAWLIEIAELSGFKKAEVEAIKHFISKQEDTFRPAYGRVTETYRRQCVFFGTTNQSDFLRDPTGNRRFLPVDINIDKADKDVFEDLDKEQVGQIWAEAFQMYRKGEKLVLSEEADLIAKRQQRGHSEVDDRKGIIEEFLEKKVPIEWDEMDIFERRNFLNDPLTAKGEVIRTEVSSVEVWCECFGKNREEIEQYKTKEINSILKSLDGWELAKGQKRIKHYGKQRVFVRVNDLL